MFSGHVYFKTCFILSWENTFFTSELVNHNVVFCTLIFSRQVFCICIMTFFQSLQNIFCFMKWVCCNNTDANLVLHNLHFGSLRFSFLLSYFLVFLDKNKFISFSSLMIYLCSSRQSRFILSSRQSRFLFF